MSKKTALITGITGQDGALLADYLLKQDYKIIAPTRNKPNLSRLESLEVDINKGIDFITYQKWTDFKDIIKYNQPHEIYHLAAQSFVDVSF